MVEQRSFRSRRRRASIVARRGSARRGWPGAAVRRVRRRPLGDAASVAFALAARRVSKEMSGWIDGGAGRDDLVDGGAALAHRVASAWLLSSLEVGMGWRIRGAAVFALLAMLALVPAEARADRAFTPRFSTNDTGNIAVAAAPLMACSTAGTNGGRARIARGLDACERARRRATTSTPRTTTTTRWSAVDTDGDPVTTVNSSTATLALRRAPPCCSPASYWGADQSAGNNNGAARPRPPRTPARRSSRRPGPRIAP